MTPERMKAAASIAKILKKINSWERKIREIFGDDSDFPWNGLSDVVLDLIGVPKEKLTKPEEHPEEWPEGDFCRDVYSDFLFDYESGTEATIEWDDKPRETFKGKAILDWLEKEAKRLSEQFPDPLSPESK